MAAATSCYSTSPYSSHWEARGATPSYHTARSAPISIPARSAPRSSAMTSTSMRRATPASSSSSREKRSAPITITTSTRDRRSNVAPLIYSSSSLTYLDGNGSPRSPTTKSGYRVSSSPGYSSRRASGAYSASPSSPLVEAYPPSPSSSSPKKRRPSSVSFAEAPIVLNESPTRERFERKYNVECLQSAKSIVEAMANVTITNSSSSRRNRNSAGSPPSSSRANELHEAKLKSGMTALPRNLVGKEAVEQLGYRGEVTTKTVTIFTALSKDQIDCLIALTEALRKKESRKSGDKQTVIILEADKDNQQMHHFSPKKSSTCQTPHKGGCTAACFSKELDNSCDCKDCRR